MAFAAYMAHDVVLKRMKEWADGTLESGSDGVDVRQIGVGVHLAARRDARRQEIFRRYLVSGEGGERVDSLLFAALEAGEWVVETEMPGPEVWLALGERMRPGFVVRVPVVRERNVPPATQVKQVELGLEHKRNGFKE